MEGDCITDVSGIAVGHYTDRQSATGCTVVLCESGAVGGVSVRGSAPGTLETDMLRPAAPLPEVHGIVLSGGSVFGLESAFGVVRYLEERGIGIKFAGVVIPRVAAAVVFDLGLVTGKVRPGLDDGYRACENAGQGPVAEGSVGAVTGATVAKVLGDDRAMKGGIGAASVHLGAGLVVGAIVAVNAVGDVVDPGTGDLLAGPRHENGTSMLLMTAPGFSPGTGASPTNTTIGVVATNARLDKGQASKLASVAHDGIALSIRPAHTTSDGDTMFALATGRLEERASMDRLCAAAVIATARAIVNGVRQAVGLGGIPGVAELRRSGYG